MSRKINLEQQLEYKGYWYLPSSPDKKIAGILTYYPNDKIVLELIGCFNDPFISLLEDNEENVIYGKTSDAKDITLLQCHQSGTANFSAEFPIVKYSCNYIVIGKHINSFDERCKYWVSFRIPELTLWCYPAALTNNVMFNDKGNQISKMIVSTNLDNDGIICSANIDDNTTLHLRRDVHYDGSMYFLNPQFEQYTYVEIIKQSEVSINELLSDIHTFEHFISLASFNIVECTDISLFDDGMFQQVESRKHYKEISLIHRYNKSANRRSKLNRDFLFKYSTIKDVYPEIIRNWYNVPKNLYPIRHHLISSLENKSYYSSVDFLIIIQAIEGFWWRFRDKDYKKKNAIPRKKNTLLNTIIKELLDEFSDIELLNNCEIDITEVVDSRHYYSHFVEQTKKPKKLDGWDLIALARRLRILLICCVLSFVGFQHSHIDTIFKKSNYRLQ